MSNHNITVDGGTSVRLPTAGKYCDRDILVTALPGGVELPDLENPGNAADLMAGKQLIDGEGKVVDGSFTIATEMTEQNSLIDQIKSALKGKAAGGGGEGQDIPSGYKRCDYIQFTGNQWVDTGIIGTQDTQIHASFVWENSTQRHLFGCASSNNDKSITSYMNGSWRFGSKSTSKSISTKNALLPYSVLVNKTTISINSSVTSISGVADFETVGTLLLGAARDADGTEPSVGIYARVYLFCLWQGEELVRKLIPVTDGNGMYRFFDMVSKTFFDSTTSTPLSGGNL